MNRENQRLGYNLEEYLRLFIENCYCETKKRPSVLVELQKEFFSLNTLKDVGGLSDSDHEKKNTLDNVLNLLKSNIEEKELEMLKGTARKEWSNYKGDKLKKINEKIELVEKLVDKAIKKHYKLSKTSFFVHKDNLEGMDIAIKQNKFSTYNWVSLLDGNNQKATFTFGRGMEVYLTNLRREIDSVKSVTNDEEIRLFDSMSNEKKVLEEYDKMVSQGKINSVSDKKITFLGKLGFQPLKKHMSEKEIVEKLSKTSNVIDLLDYAISTINKEKSGIQFSKTLEDLKELRKKYSVVSNKLRDDLKNSNYENMKNLVEEQKEMERQEEINKLNREKVKLLYKKILVSDNDEEIKKMLEEIRFVKLSSDEKEEEKKNASIEYEEELENKRINSEIIKEEYRKEQEYKAEIANGLRQRAIQALEISGAFSSDYYESDLDVRDGMTPDKMEELINAKMNELKNEEKITKQQQALQDLKDQGFLKREDAELSNLKPFERDALLAQMRINERAEEVRESGYNR